MNIAYRLKPMGSGTIADALQLLRPRCQVHGEASDRPEAGPLRALAWERAAPRRVHPSDIHNDSHRFTRWLASFRLQSFFAEHQHKRMQPCLENLLRCIARHPERV